MDLNQDPPPDLVVEAERAQRSWVREQQGTRSARE